VGHIDHQGRTYYFCSQNCLDQFRANPDSFLAERPAPAATSADIEREYTCPMDPEVRQKGPGACPKCGMALEPVDVAPLTKTEWTCPMHPEIVRDAPGSCPICGMALERRVVTLEDRNPELDDMSRRFWCQTVMFIAVDRRPAGLVGVADPVKETTPEAIEALHRDGVRVVMLTGDNRTTAEAVARSVGIDQIEADVLPDQKAAVVKRLQERGERVAMAGDGVNDAPALAAADVGIAMGTGTDVAIESAGVTLVKGDLRGIVRARRLSKATMSNPRQNLIFAFVYNVLGVPVAAGVLYPFLGLLLSPMIASAAMTFSSVSVVGNALRLRRISL
jgi:soluble P-type ATPase